MNVDEVASFLRINRNTVYNAVAVRRIPHRRLGRRILFSRSALLQWLTGGTEEIVAGTAANRERLRFEAQQDVRPNKEESARIVQVAGRRSSAQIEALKTRVLQAVKEQPLMGAQHYANVLHTTTYEIGQILGRLVADGLLSRTGHASKARYRPL